MRAGVDIDGNAPPVGGTTGAPNDLRGLGDVASNQLPMTEQGWTDAQRPAIAQSSFVEPSYGDANFVPPQFDVSGPLDGSVPTEVTGNSMWNPANINMMADDQMGPSLEIGHSSGQDLSMDHGGYPMHANVPFGVSSMQGPPTLLHFSDHYNG